MAINPDLLVAAPVLQNYLVDKDTGRPLVNGIVSLYKDTSRSIYKNWYYQTGSPGAYEYVPLENPLHLSSVGTIQDETGNDVIPFYYPYEENDENFPEAYYITVYSADSEGNPNVLQFTRENFPFHPANSSPIAQNPTWRNYVLNNVYWRNAGTIDCKNITDRVISPSQHDGYTNSDIRFIKDITGATETLTFESMTETLENDITPELCIRMTCTAAQLGETQKCIQYPVSLHVKSLQNVSATCVIHAQNVVGNDNNYLDIYVYQFLGTGAIAQPDPVFLERITLSNSGFQKFIIPFIFPDAEGETLGVGEDDALFILVQYPLAVTYDIRHTKVQVYLSNDVPDNDFDTKDEIEAIINSPRTGDHRISHNTSMYGWVSCNNNSIGSTASVASNRANNDTWPLYKLLWESVLNQWAPVSGGRGANAYADFTANKTIQLTENLGRVIIGADPSIADAVNFTANAGTDILTLASARSVSIATPVQVYNTGGALPSGLSASAVYFVSMNSLTATTVKLSLTLEDAQTGVDIDIIDAGTGTQTMISALGLNVGESTHALTEAENATHTHGLGNDAIWNNHEDDEGVFPIDGGDQFNGLRLSLELVSDPSGSGTPHNTIQPSTYRYVYLKL